MTMTKMEKDNAVRLEVIRKFPALQDFTRIDTGAFVIMIEDAEGEEKFVEVKFVVKGKTFDLDDAVEAYEDKVAKAEERAEEKAAKDAEKAAKDAEKAAKEAAKAAKAEVKE